MNMLHHNIITACTITISERATIVAAHRLVVLMVTSQSLVLFRLVSVDVAIEEKTLRNALIIL